MSSSNWIGLMGSRESVQDQNSHCHYHIDNVGLQLGLGLPIELLDLGVTVGNVDDSRQNGQRLMRINKSMCSNIPNIPQDVSIQQTVDGIPIRKVYATNINIEVQRKEIYYIFGHFGSIRNVFLGVSKNHNSKQFAFITFTDPKDASRVLVQRKFQDGRGRYIYVTAADSWHQPKEGPDGRIVWSNKAQGKQEGESDEEDEQILETASNQLSPAGVVQEGFNILNDDCLLHIFSFFSLTEIAGVERVCKRWQALSFRMWRCLHKLSFSEAPFLELDATTPTLEQYLKRCGESLAELDLTVSDHGFSETTLAVIAKYCCNLEVLRVAEIYVGNRSLAHLGHRCPKLKQLVMDDCTKFDDSDLMSLLPKCNELNHLDLSLASNITGSCLIKIMSPMTSLRLCNCPKLEASNLISGLQRVSQTLENLTLNACCNLSSNEIARIACAVPNLSSLTLCSCSTQFDVKALSHGQLSKLTSLDLNLNRGVNDNILSAIVEGCEQLTSINLSGSGGGCAGNISHRGISVLSHLRKLTDLDISYLEAANNEALKNLSTRSTRLKRLLCRGCPDLTDEGSVQVLAMCNDLELFDLSGCNHIAESTISAALTSVKMRTNNIPLRLIVGGTNVQPIVADSGVPLLTVDPSDLSEDHLRPDFIDDMFFPASDSDGDEDLDYLCERMGCDCDFEFDDLYDPTLFPCDFDDDTPKFGEFDDTPDMCAVHWTDRENDDYNDENYESWD